MELIEPEKEHLKLLDGSYFGFVATKVLENAYSNTVLRCCGPMGHLTTDTIAYESVGAHTNLMHAIVDYALDYIQGNKLIKLHYRRRSLTEAIRMHDLPENITGDIPDNSARDEEKKNQEDTDYFYQYTSMQSDNIIYRTDALQLLEEMQEKSSPEGKILYLADKLAAIIMALCYDKMGYPPVEGYNDPGVSLRNQEAMRMCDIVTKENRYMQSEIWTIDFLVQRKHVQYDETGFFTALLVMATLICHKGRWYNWRQANYIS